MAKKWIALFRGINVGGHGKIRMADLVATLSAIGLSDVRTYIQSGNVVFASKGREGKLAEKIAQAVEDTAGFRPNVLVLDVEEFRRAAMRSPYPQTEASNRTVHLFFLSEEPSEPDWDKLEQSRSSSEEFHLDGKVFYLHTPAGFGKSKLAAKIEKALGVSATARNWRSVNAILELADAD